MAIAVRQRPPIDWALLGRAVKYYINIGYTYVEVPWVAPHPALAVTLPPDRPAFFADDRDGLVGSAEQAFIALDYSGQLGRGRFVACTPCFRREPEDTLHLPWFMKVELYRNDVVSRDTMLEMQAHAFMFFNTALGLSVTPRETAEGWDLEHNGIEIGSYGLRQHGSLQWVYGTGLALPRLTQAQAMRLTHA